MGETADTIREVDYSSSDGLGGLCLCLTFNAVDAALAPAICFLYAHALEREGIGMSDQTVTRSFAIDPRETNPKAQELHINAVLFLQDAEKLDNMASAGPYVLLMHTIELALKCFLLSNGITLKKLWSRAFGHDLDKLLSEAVKRGLVLSDSETKSVVSELNHYTKHAAIRYEFYYTMPVLPLVIKAARSIVEAARPPLPTAPLS
jgi:hypothetical protein